MVDYMDSGVLFRNDRKQSDKSPDYTGKINVGGVEKRLAAWVRDKGKGKFLSIKVSDFQERQEPRRQPDPLDDGAPVPSESDYGAGGLDDEIPFDPAPAMIGSGHEKMLQMSRDQALGGVLPSPDDGRWASW